MNGRYELSEHFAALRDLGPEASVIVDEIEALLRDCWIDSYNRNYSESPRTDTCRCSLGEEWAPLDRPQVV